MVLEAIDGLGSVFVGLFLILTATLVIFASGTTTILVGAALLAAVLLVLYYALVRFDRWARGKSNGGGTSRQGDY